ncbi:uncharacterized protein LOC121416457 [Lytechinus variegatus]|uniref:uncharacterized protein LOC121416457 n=1 Tax=Lytechinus variegatus TaxID=7654 RepID=UPI001BB10671|nr:uncharacterized protein LOC121416457 [Lytechinus variegatus]
MNLKMHSLSSTARVGEADKCYSCAYVSTTPDLPGNDPRCQDPFPRDSNVTVVDCSNGCLKTSTDLGDDGQSWLRGCVDVVEACANTCQTVEGYTACFHCCDGDFCNGVDTVYPAKLLAMLCASFVAVAVYN